MFRFKTWNSSLSKGLDFVRKVEFKISKRKDNLIGEYVHVAEGRWHPSVNDPTAGKKIVFCLKSRFPGEWTDESEGEFSVHINIKVTNNWNIFVTGLQHNVHVPGSLIVASRNQMLPQFRFLYDLVRSRAKWTKGVFDVRCLLFLARGGSACSLSRRRRQTFQPAEFYPSTVEANACPLSPLQRFSCFLFNSQFQWDLRSVFLMGTFGQSAGRHSLCLPGEFSRYRPKR